MKKKASSQYPIHDLIAQRWSPRAFNPARTLDREQVLSILEAGRWAPSCNNGQPWRYIVGLNFDASHAKLFSALTLSNQAWAKNAPLLICAVASKVWTGKAAPNDWAEQDTGISLGYMLLQSTALDIHSHPMAGFSRERIQESFSLPTDLRPMTVIAFGYYGAIGTLEEHQQVRENAARERMPQSEFILNSF
jgi:nitroreductase